MQILALISIYAPVVITIITVIASRVLVLLGISAAAALDVECNEPTADPILALARAASTGVVEICRSSRALSLHEMDINKMLAELRTEREQVEEAIIVLERMARGRGRRRGRPPAWMTTVKRRGRPPGSKNKPKADS
jgi:hypothetical protein